MFDLYSLGQVVWTGTLAPGRDPDLVFLVAAETRESLLREIGGGGIFRSKNPAVLLVLQSFCWRR